MSEIIQMNGPKAPKDPTKKTQAFYIMRNKSVCGSLQPDGRGIQFIYEDGGRLISAAKLIGNVSDENMLKLLADTDGFKKLVHSIGVCVETEDEVTEAVFAFQHYGKTDTYNSGTTISIPVKTDGTEHLMILDSFEWTNDDKCPGQIRFEFPKAGMIATVSVKLYLNDGFIAPEQEEENDIDLSSEAYKEMIKKSLMLKGNTGRIKKAIDKAKAGEDVTLAFIGGSITQGAGAIPINHKCYAYKAFEGFCNLAGRKVDENVHYIKAGMGGTPSELGMIRYDRDVLRDNSVSPDIVVVEFAVNDAGDETNGKCFDSLIRKIYNNPNKPAVIILFAVFQDDFNLQDRLKCVGYRYNVPMVSIKDCVVWQFNLKPSEGRIVSRGQYFYDCFHPTNIGHKIMADGLINLFEEAECDSATDGPDNLDSVEPAIGKEFENVKLLDKKSLKPGTIIREGDFDGTETFIQSVEMDEDMTVTPEFPYNWMYNGEVHNTNKPFEMEIECKALLIVYKDSHQNEYGVAEVYVDGEKKLEIDPKAIGWVHANPYICINDTVSKKHVVSVSMKQGYEDKCFAILGFGYVE